MNLYCFHRDLCKINLMWYHNTYVVYIHKFICQNGQMSSGPSGPMLLVKQFLSIFTTIKISSMAIEIWNVKKIFSNECKHVE